MQFSRNHPVLSIGACLSVIIFLILYLYYNSFHLNNGLSTKVEGVKKSEDDEQVQTVKCVPSKQPSVIQGKVFGENVYADKTILKQDSSSGVVSKVSYIFVKVLSSYDAF